MDMTNTHVVNMERQRDILIMCLCVHYMYDRYTCGKHREIERYKYHVSPCLLQPIADKVAGNPEIISKNFQFSTRRTRILMGFEISTMLLLDDNHKSHELNSGTMTKL